MSDKTSTPTSGGIGFFGLLTVVFITLKLTHVIAWSWWWVLAPLIAPIALVLLICAVVLGAALWSEVRK
jgi:hypothetical protein